MKTEHPKSCPSATCSKGASLLGVVNDDHTVTLLDVPLKVDDEFIKKSHEFGQPERRLRFTDKCVKSGCGQWTGHSCGVMDELADLNGHIKDDDEPLPPCFIRRTCRWFSQEGGRACKICLFVVTESRDEKLVS